MTQHNRQLQPKCRGHYRQGRGRFIEINAGFGHQFGWSSEQTLSRTSLELGIGRAQNIACA